MRSPPGWTPVSTEMRHTLDNAGGGALLLTLELDMDHNQGEHRSPSARRRVQLGVREGDSVASLAASFVTAHGLSPDTTEAVEHIIQGALHTHGYLTITGRGSEARRVASAAGGGGATSGAASLAVRAKKKKPFLRC